MIVARLEGHSPEQTINEIHCVESKYKRNFTKRILITKKQSNKLTNKPNQNKTKPTKPTKPKTNTTTKHEHNTLSTGNPCPEDQVE
jgi:hypothetical protein